MRVLAARVNRYFLTIVAGILFAAICWTGQTASAQQAEWKGYIESMPVSDLIGEWTVGGRTFVTNVGTEFRQEKGPFATDVCVEVEYVGSVTPYTATKIATKDTDDCSDSASTPSPTPSPSVTPTPDGVEREAYGIVESMPSSGFVGLWRLDGLNYEAPVGAEFEQEAGPLVIDACVKVHYRSDTSPFTVREMKTMPASFCDDASPTPGVTPTPSDEIEIYGRIEAFPSELIGEWMVKGVVYDATDNTEFEQENGLFVIGACVKIHADSSASPATIREIETKRDYRCSNDGGGGDSEAELYGVLQSFPTGLTGAWNIAGMTFAADSATQFKQEHGSFAVGVTVKVHFTTDATGANRTREIETKFANDDDGEDDDGNGSVDGAEGHAYGLIDSYPSDLFGTWQISGVEYVATAGARFAQDDGAFAANARVKVEYFVGSDGQRSARKIETTDDEGGATESSHAVFFGFVRQTPANGLVGQWVVDNANFVADANAEFKENNGLLGLGAYVAVEYSSQDGQNRVHEIETHVPPGAGSESTLGVIDDTGRVLTGAGVQAATWMIDGVRFTVLPATALNDEANALVAGNSVIVNSYVTGDGSQVATRIRGITAISRIYLPAIQR